MGLPTKVTLTLIPHFMRPAYDCFLYACPWMDGTSYPKRAPIHFLLGTFGVEIAIFGILCVGLCSYHKDTLWEGE